MKEPFRVSRFGLRVDRSSSRRHAVAAVAIAGCLLFLAACSSQKGASSEDRTPKPLWQTVSAPGRAVAAPTTPPAHFDGARAFQFTKEVVGFGPRPVGSPGHAKAETYIRGQLKPYDLVEDAFTASSPGGPKPMRNFIAKFPGTKDGIIVVAGHYDTKPLPGFVGANDGGSSTGLPLELARELGATMMKNGKRAGYSVWVALLDGEESIQQSNQMDFSNSMYGSQRLAELWAKDGTLGKIKAFLLVDMIGDADLDILRDTNSTPWLQDTILQAATRFGYQSHFYRDQTAMEDDHIPFVRKGVPAADLIDFTYGYDNAFWHTKADTMDKLSPKSFEIVGSVLLETVRLLDQK